MQSQRGHKSERDEGMSPRGATGRDLAPSHPHAPPQRPPAAEPQRHQMVVPQGSQSIYMGHGLQGADVRGKASPLPPRDDKTQPTSWSQGESHPVCNVVIYLLVYI